MQEHRKIWIEQNGAIPLDEEGRTYEIHHIDGDHTNNDPVNLKCVSIQEHYDIHYSQGDWGACVLIAKRMKQSANYLSQIQLGKKRPGIGGVKKGTIPWNKGKSFDPNVSEQGKINRNNASKKRAKISDELAKSIRMDYNNKIDIIHPKLGIKQRNGKLFSYERAFSEIYALKHNVTSTYIFGIINGKFKQL